jgi:hypothetical protein
MCRHVLHPCQVFVPTRTTSLSSLGPVVKMINYYRALDATSREKCVTKTITVIIATLHTEVHQGPVEQGFIGNHLHGSDVSEFIHARYGSLVKFLQDGRRFCGHYRQQRYLFH